MSGYNSFKEKLERVRALRKMMGEYSDLGRELGEVADIAEAAFINNHPFKPGQKVTLTKDQNCKEGWYSWRHILLTGHSGTVHDIGLWPDGEAYVYYIPDEKTWMGSNGEVREEKKDVLLAIRVKYLTIRSEDDMSYSEGI